MENGGHFVSASICYAVFKCFQFAHLDQVSHLYWKYEIYSTEADVLIILHTEIWALYKYSSDT